MKGPAKVEAYLSKLIGRFILFKIPKTLAQDFLALITDGNVSTLYQFMAESFSHGRSGHGYRVQKEWLP